NLKDAWVLGVYGQVSDHLAQNYQKRGRKDDADRTYAKSMSAVRPANETRTRLASLVSGEAKVSPAVEQHRLDFQSMRTIKLGKIAPASGSADFFVVIAFSTGTSRVEAVKFISGEDKLEALTDALRNTKIDFTFPD